MINHELGMNNTIQLQNFHLSIHNCLHDIIAMMVLYYDESYTAMYKNLWLFNFNDIPKEMDIAQRINYEYEDPFDGLEKINSLIVEYHMFYTINEMKLFIQEEITELRPVCMYIDAFDCPWNPAYQQYHATHYVLITSINGDQLLCNDPFLSVIDKTIDIKTLTLNCLQCISIQKKGQIKQYSKYLLLKEVIQDMESIKSFAKMETFAKNMGAISTCNEIFFNNSDIESQLLIRKINTISCGRTCFLLLLEEFYNEIVDSSILNGFQSSAENWSIINSLLIRSFLRNKYENYSQKIVDAMNKIIRIETQLFNTLKCRIQEESLKRNDMQQSVDRNKRAHSKQAIT